MDLLLIGLTAAAWAVHSGVAAAYQTKFASTKSVPFRLTHAIEIFITVSIMLIVFLALRDTIQLWYVAMAAHVLGTLIILDGLSLIGLKRLREQFDVGHFALAYGVVAAAVAIIYWIARI